MKTSTSHLIVLALVTLTPFLLVAQPIAWPAGKKAVIVLTYDDGITSQLDNAIPALDKHHLKGTFFIDGTMPYEEILRWLQASEEGHELANHSIYHPCSQETLSLRRQYVNENYDRYAIIREIAMMNRYLFALDHKTKRTFAYPCTETIVGGKDYVDTLRTTHLVTSARIGGDKVPITDLKHLDLFRVPSWAPTDVYDGNVLIEYAKMTLDKGGLGIFQFHGIGGDYLKVSAEAHEKLLDYLLAHPEIWVATYQEATDYVAAHQQ
jgi:peptidoglycan-N-acetylglucosamine deacetylase